MSDEKGRNWATIVYPESAPIGWMEILEALHVKAFISPLHDEDVDEKTGEIKKPHYHVETMYDGTIGKKRAEQDFALIGGVGCKRLTSKTAYARYLCHLDDPDKWQYSPDDVICLGGADYMEIITRGKESHDRIQSEMEDFIDEHKMFSYAMFSQYCRKNNWAWYKVLQRRGNAIMRYMKSIVWTVGERQTRAAVYQNAYCPDWIQLSEEGFESSDGEEKVPV